MGLNEYRNRPWFVSTNTTAAGVALEYNPISTAKGAYGVQFAGYRLRGYSISGSTAVAVSSTPIKLIYGASSGAALTSEELCNEPGAGMVGVNGIMGIEGGYFALETTVAHADGGLTFSMWGD